MKNYIKLLFILVVLLVTSCSEDFLQKDVLVNNTSNNFYDTDDNAMSGLYALYNVLRGQETYGTNKWVLGSIASDIAEGGGEPGGADQPDKQKIDRMVQDPRNTIMEEYWYGWYAGIYRANILLQEVEGNGNLTPEVSDKITGEAYLIRALCYFELVMAFGGVPVITEILPVDELNIPRSSIASIFNLIESDLGDASDYLEPYRNEPKKQGRANYGTARALLVKALVYESSYAEQSATIEIYSGCEDRWTDARDIAEEIITNEGTYGYALDPDFANIWRVEGELSSEHIFSVNCVSLAGYESPRIGDGDPNDFETRLGIGQIGCVYQTTRGYYRGTRAQTDFDNLGWGFNVPTDYLVDSYQENDPRIHSTVVTDGYKWKLTVDSDTVNLWTGWSPTGYAAAKYMQWPKEKGSGVIPHGGALDIKVFRYADLLLLAAEANLKTGNTGRATQLVNWVVGRARESGNSGTPADYATVTMDDILQERMLELATEGHRFFDLVRTGKATEFLNGHYNNTIQTAIEFEQGKHELFPIPASEIIRTQNAITQNFGY